MYHRLKDLLPPGSSLLVAPIDVAPKFKGLEPGLGDWLRQQL